MVLVTICGRGGSKGIPGKNIRNLAGVPLIAYSIKHANEFIEKEKAILSLSTDSSEIKRVAEELGLKTDYIRPDDLASDTAGKIGVLRDLLKYEENRLNKRFEYLLDLDITSPIRNLTDLLQGFQLIKSDKNALNLFSVSNAHKNPYFNMVEQKNNGYFATVKNASSFNSRQLAPRVYEMNASFYFYKREFFDLPLNSAITEHSLIYLMPHLCFDLDEENDFEYLEFLVQKGKIGL